MVRTLLMAIGVAPLGVAIAAGAASCVLADPPPALETIPELSPQILSGSVPPGGITVTNWEATGNLSFVVPVQIYARTNFLVFWDYRNPLLRTAGPPTSPTAASPSVDAGGIEVVSFTLNPLPQPSCHTITFFADADETLMEAPFSCQNCTSISWTYDPTGGGGCPTYDAGGIADGDIRHDFDSSNPHDALADMMIVIPQD
jgi:hypothetical protein